MGSYNWLHFVLFAKAETREMVEHFVELPAELCSLKIVGFSKDIGSSLSLLPSLMHRLENLLVAIELKEVFLASFPEAYEVRANCVKPFFPFVNIVCFALLLCILLI